MAAQHRHLLVAECGGDALASFETEHLYLFVIEERPSVVERARLLGDGFDGSTRGTERSTPRGVRVSHANDVGASLVDRMMNVIRRRVDRRTARGLAVGSDEDKIVDRRLLESTRETQQPHVVGVLRIPSGDVAVAQVAPAQRGEDPVAERDRFFAASPFGLDVGIGHCYSGNVSWVAFSSATALVTISSTTSRSTSASLLM